MPFEWYKDMSDDDLLSIVAYIKSVPAVHNPVPDKQLNFVPKALLAFKVIKPQKPTTDVIVAPPEGPTVEYGKYLSSHISSCGECHTPLNLQTGRYYLDRPFTGGSIAFEDQEVSVNAPNITPDQLTGIGTWSEEEFITALRTGLRPDGTVIMPMFMPWLIYKDLSDEDLQAIYRYLRSLPPASNTVAVPEIAPGETGPARAHAMYQAYCASCHGDEGGGTFITEVPIRQAAPATEPGALRQVIEDGMPGTVMPGFDLTFTEEEMTELVQFVRTWEGP
jgi:mono/diheme cytochrome c family protein